MKRDVGYWDGFYIIHRHTGLIFVIEIKKKKIIQLLVLQRGVEHH